MASNKRFFAACPRDCYDTCAMYAFINEGMIAKVVGRRDHGLTKGFLCRKGQNILDYAYSPDRLQYPMERTGHSGPCLRHMSPR